MQEKLRLAVVGAGTVAELYHLPAAARHPHIEITALVERERARAQRLAARYQVPAVLDDWADVPKVADAALIALPHFLHAPAAVDLMTQGVHVLVEKPMALTSADAQRMVDTTHESGCALAVGFQCRFYRNAQLVKHLLASGQLGRIESFEVEQGGPFSWPVIDGTAFRPETGGGSLTGIGIHALDLALWWFGDYSAVTYFDDAMGGVEADCEVRLSFPDGVQGTLAFSHRRALRNRWRIVAERGTLEMGTSFDQPLRLSCAGTPLQWEGLVHEGEAPDTHIRDVLMRQFDDLVRAARGGAKPLVNGEEGLRTVRLYEACQRVRQPLQLPWVTGACALDTSPARAAGGAA
ncbi:Gfo/Idh/MocA family oxidoreductase [Ectothiorhodospiraceae bacterium 2226]|nr:Gfo/Idh/MocA family oxidoreductase [Ectothiorhodospiraceae bacterium 2226]